MTAPAWTAEVERIDQVPETRRSFVRYLRDHADGQSDIAAAELVFTELLSNALRYGKVALSLEWHQHTARLRVHDHGAPFHAGEREEPALNSERGRGLFLVQRLAQMLTYERDGDGNIASAVLPVRLGAGAGL